MPVRKLKRSRAGCKACKAKHRKCDETAPVCVACQTAGTHCSIGDIYKAPTPSSRHNGLHYEPILVTLPTTQESLSSTLVQLSLLHHLLMPATTGTFDDQQTLHNVASYAIKHGLDRPYLLPLLLSVGAKHYALTSDCDERHHAQHNRYASDLQEQALRLFNVRQRAPDDDDAAPFLFSSMIGLCLMVDLAHSPDHRRDQQTFFKRFGCYMQTHRGTRVMGLGNCQDHEVLMLVRKAEHRFSTGAKLSKGECRPLLTLAQSLDCTGAVRQIYIESIHALQTCFDVQAVPQGLETSFWADVLAWPVTAPVGFAERVSERDDLAVILVAYFAVLLHRYKDIWVFGDIGHFTVATVKQLLGDRLEQYMSYPKDEVLGTN